MNEPTPQRFPWHFALGVTVVCLALTVATYALAVGPLLERHDQGIALRGELEARLGEARELGTSVDALQRDLAAARADLQRMPLQLQPAAQINQRLEAVARLATECGLALDEVRPGGAVDAAHYQTVPVRIVGSGDYPACARFLGKLRKSFADMGVRTFTASHQGGAATASGAMFQAELVWFTELPRK